MQNELNGSEPILCVPLLRIDERMIELLGSLPIRCGFSPMSAVALLPKSLDQSPKAYRVKKVGLAAGWYCQVPMQYLTVPTAYL